MSLSRCRPTASASFGMWGIHGSAGSSPTHWLQSSVAAGAGFREQWSSSMFRKVGEPGQYFCTARCDEGTPEKALHAAVLGAMLQYAVTSEFSDVAARPMQLLVYIEVWIVWAVVHILHLQSRLGCRMLQMSERLQDL